MCSGDGDRCGRVRSKGDEEREGEGEGDGDEGDKTRGQVRRTDKVR